MAYDGSIKFDTSIDTKKFKAGIAAISAAAVAGLGGAVKAGIDFESAFAGVKKTVNATEDQLAKMRQGIQDMALEMPMAAADIAGIAESAGQLGIQTDNILGFTKVMADLGVATNLAGEEAATTLARFANITGMSQDNFDRLGATIVDLGNNLATTESEIAAMGLRLAGAGSQVGMTEAQILSFAGALSSVGIEADAGGTAFSTVMSKMQLAAETGGESLNNFAKVSGMTAKDFKTAFQKDATSAILSFIKGLSKSEEQGISAIKVLNDMGISEIRMRDALLRAAGASDVFEDAIRTGTKAWEENTALTKEAEQRYETMESQLGIMKNSAINLGIAVYDGIQEPLKNAVADGTENIKELTDSFESGGLQIALEKTGNLLGDLFSGAIELAAGALPVLAGGLSFVADTLGLIVTVGGMVVAGIAAYNITVGLATAAQTAWNAAMLANPVGLVIAAMAAAGVAVYGIVQACKSAEEAYWNLGDEIESTGTKFEEAKTKSQLTDEYAAEWRNLKDAIASNKLPSEELAAAQQRVQDIEKWFIDNYESYISAEEQKNGIRAETIGLLQDQAANLSEIARIELSNKLLEERSRVPELSKDIAKLQDLNTELDNQNIKYLESNNVMHKASLAWRSLTEEQRLSGEYQNVYNAMLEEINSTLGTNYDSYRKVTEALADNEKAIQKNKEKVEENNQKIADGTQSLQQYADGARRLIELDLGGTYEEASNKMALLQAAQNELNTSGQLSKDTMQKLNDTFPELEGKENIPEAIAQEMENLSTKIDAARKQAQDLGTDLLGIPTDIPVNIRIQVFGKEQLTGIPQYAKGTRFAKPGLSVVNERGTELIQGRDGAFRYVDSQGPALTVLNRGDRVYTAARSRMMLAAASKRIPGFANGFRMGYPMPSVTKFAISGQLESKLGSLGKELIQGLAAGIMKNEKIVAKALDSLSEEMLESEREYLREKDRIDQARAAEEEAKQAAEYEQKLKDAKDAQEREKIQQEELARIQKAGEDARLAQLKETADNEKKIMDALKDDIRAVYSDIADYATEHIGQVSDAQKQLSDKLEDFGSLTYTVDMGSGMTYERLADLGEYKKVLSQYNQDMQQVKDRIVAAGFDSEVISRFMAEMADLSTGEAIKTARAIAGASDDVFRQYMQDWKDISFLADQSAALFYQEDMEEAVDESVTYMRTELEKLGVEVPDGFFASGTLSAKNFGKGFMAEMDAVMESVRELVNSFNASLTPQFAYPGGGGTYTSTVYGDTNYNIYGGNAGDLTAQIQAMETRKRMLGIGG